MKRALLTALFLGAIAALGGCPIYNHEDDGCYRNSDCAPGYVCDDGSGDCYLPGGNNSCSRPSDCGSNLSCSRGGQCLSGDCSFNGCVAGYRCDSSSGVWSCVSGSSPSSGGAGNEAGATSSTAGSADMSVAGAAESTAGAAGSAGGG